MKSLEIVNDEIEMRKGNILNDAEWNRLKKLETIQQDLEVLEIIRKKKVDMTYFVVAIHSNLPIDEQINYYNRSQSNYCKLLDEEFIKLKQWLEEN